MLSSRKHVNWGKTNHDRGRRRGGQGSKVTKPKPQGFVVEQCIFLSSETETKIVSILEQFQGAKDMVVPSRTPGGPSSEGFKWKYIRNKLANSRANIRGHEVKLTSSLMARNPVVDLQLKKELNRKWNLEEYKEMLRNRRRLPAYKAKDDLLDVLEKNQVTVISGETGSGKTTQVGQFILEKCIYEEDGSVTNIICTQPRRISAITCSERVAKEMGEDLGESVGYSIRLENKLPRLSSGSLLYCTTGIILQRFKEDPTLSKVSHIIVDEVHERDILVDFLMALLKDLIIVRPDLKVILMSATLDAKKFQAYFPNAALFHIPGLTFPVTDYYLEDVLIFTRFKFPSLSSKRDPDPGFDNFITPYLEQLKESKIYNDPCVVMELAKAGSEDINFHLIQFLLNHICKRDRNNDHNNGILIFLPGWAEISELYNLLKNSGRFPESCFLLIPLHSTMPTVNQREVFNRPPRGVRKIVISTNIAETSITIDDIVYVIDGGRMNVSNYDAGKNLETLDSGWVSRANAVQRRGRAGRTQPGICYHLFTKHRESTLEAAQKPEILRKSLEEVILQIKSLGLGSAHTFLQKLMDSPELKSITNAIERLQGIGALDDEENLTPLGFHLSLLPMDSLAGKMIIYGAIFSCLDPILSVAACLSFQDPFYTPIGKEEDVENVRKKMADGSKSDHIVMIRAIKGFETALRIGNERSFCYDNFLSSSTSKRLINYKGQFAQYLHKQGFLDSAEYKNEKYNRNSENIALIIGIICGGLYPNLAICTFNQLNRTIVNVKTKDDGDVNVHPKGVNASRSPELEFPFLVYYKKMRVKRISLFDTTMVMPLHLVFFGGILAWNNNNIEISGQNIGIKCYSRFSIIQDLRNALDKFLAEKIENPGVVDWSVGSKDGGLLKIVIELISNEYNLKMRENVVSVRGGNQFPKSLDPRKGPRFVSNKWQGKRKRNIEIMPDSSIKIRRIWKP